MKTTIRSREGSGRTNVARRVQAVGAVTLASRSPAARAARMAPHVRLALKTAARECGVDIGEIVSEVSREALADAVPQAMYVGFTRSERQRLQAAAKRCFLEPEDFVRMMTFEGVRKIEWDGYLMLSPSRRSRL